MTPPALILLVFHTLLGLHPEGVWAKATVAPPSAEFVDYLEGERVSVSIPSNWQEFPGVDAVAFAPDGAYQSVGVKSVLTHGIRMGFARNDKDDLRITTDDFIASYVLVTPRPGQTFGYRWVMVGDRPGLHTVLTATSVATGRPEQIEVFTSLLHDGTMFYLLTVAPRDRVLAYTSTFRRVMASVQILDCDLCVPSGS